MDFDAMLVGLREGDSAAKQQFVEEYHAHLQGAALDSLRISPVAKELPAADLYQTTLVAFLKCARAGKVKAHEPAQLAALLKQIIRRLVSHAERDGVRALRDVRRNDHRALEKLEIRSREPDPSDAAAEKELAERCLAGLSEEERRILLDRDAGQSFVQIGASLGIQPDAARMRYNRAFERLATAYKRLVKE
jgi:RNA polymerase sigma factor (sigma-70 family)